MILIKEPRERKYFIYLVYVAMILLMITGYVSNRANLVMDDSRKRSHVKDAFGQTYTKQYTSTSVKVLSSNMHTKDNKNNSHIESIHTDHQQQYVPYNERSQNITLRHSANTINNAIEDRNELFSPFRSSNRNDDSLRIDTFTQSNTANTSQRVFDVNQTEDEEAPTYTFDHPKWFVKNTPVPFTLFSDFLINPKELCSGFHGTLDYIIIVNTAIRHTDHRDVIRHTFGKQGFAPGQHMRLVFLVGTTDNSSRSDALAKEAAQFSDIVQVTFKIYK